MIMMQSLMVKKSETVLQHVQANLGELYLPFLVANALQREWAVSVSCY